MTRVDLDELEAFYSDSMNGDSAVVAAVAELRAAREVVAAANDLPRTVNTNAATRDGYATAALDRALVAYDKAVAP